MFRLSLVALLGAVVAHPGFAQAPKLPTGTEAFPNVAYGPHERNKLDVYVPKTDKPLPLVIWVHGGGWEAGDKAGGNPALALLGKGYAVASVNYRFSKHAPFPAQSADVRAAVRFLRANAKTYHLDPDRFGAWGASAGGHLVALLGTAPGVAELDGDTKPGDVSPKVQAVVDWFGPTDFPALMPDNTPPNVVTRLFGGTIGEKKALARLASPVNHATKDAAPFLIFQGDKDNLVPLRQSELLADALKKAGAECELVVLAGSGHGGPAFLNEANRTKTEAFLDKHLKAK